MKRLVIKRSPLSLVLVRLATGSEIIEKLPFVEVDEEQSLEDESKT